MVKFALGVEYCGSRYYGWQRQKLSNGVQKFVENALSKVANEPIRVICAGRTDTGVHALQQVIHFQTSVQRRPRDWILGGNTFLPDDISIVWGKLMKEDFHARFSALARTYQYIILNRSSRSGILQKLITWEYRALDEGRMQEAAGYLVGKHDFNAYRSATCQAKNPVRNVMRLDILRHQDIVLAEIEADGFLHHMVRNIIGVLLDIGSGKAPVSWAKDVLDGRDRTLGGVTASPHGLYLANIRYPDKYGIPAPRLSMPPISSI